jgi:hypothetical protein|tara:strand:+ start:7 stop:426 length:420 start_codon:yes stop_codon:yes gene_type:complete
MDNIVEEGIRSFERGVEAVEIVQNHNLRLVPNGKKIDLKPGDNPTSDEDKKFVFAILKNSAYRQPLLNLSSEPDAVRKALLAGQKELAQAKESYLFNLDLWDRLEKAYRHLFPEDTSCVCGEEGCVDNSGVCCKACENS